MKITLFWPLYMRGVSKPQPNISIACLSKVLEQNNFEVSCIDANLLFYGKWGYKNPEEHKKETILKKFIQEVEKTNPDILGIGGWTHLTPFVAEFGREYKAKNPPVFITFGGYNPTLLPEETLSIMPFVDSLVRGEGEYTLLELCERLSKGKNWKKIKGISYKNNGKVINTENRPVIKDINKLPFLDFENFVDFKPSESVHLMTSRSCPFSCSFCSVQSTVGHYRAHRPDYVIRQLEHLYDLYGIKYFCFEDDDFLANQERVKEISKLLLKKKPDFCIGAAGRSDEINRETIRTLNEVNFSGISMGVESVNSNAITFLNKAQNPSRYVKKTKEGIKILEEEGIPFSLFFMIGTPNETKEDMLKTLGFIEEMSGKANRIEASHLQLRPGTQLWRKYLDGEISLFKAYGSENPFEKPYEHLVWMVPDIYLLRSEHYPDEQYPQIIGEILNRVYDIKSSYGI